MELEDGYGVPVELHDAFAKTAGAIVQNIAGSVISYNPFNPANYAQALQQAQHIQQQTQIHLQQQATGGWVLQQGLLGGVGQELGALPGQFIKPEGY
jgi:hypothetical protein